MKMEGVRVHERMRSRSLMSKMQAVSQSFIVLEKSEKEHANIYYYDL